MVMGAPQESSLSPPDQAYLDQLDRLAPVLAQHGMATNLMAPAGRVPSLPAVNPAAPALAGDGDAGWRGGGGRPAHGAGPRGGLRRARPVRTTRQLTKREPRANQRCGRVRRGQDETVG